VQATTILDPGNETKWYERLVARTVNPLPILQYETAIFVLGPGSSVSSANAATNPYMVQRTGLLVEILLAAANPPVDETLVLEITDNNGVIATVSMDPSTAVNQVLITPVPASKQLYVFNHDVLNVNVSYLVTGPNPTPAGNVTLSIRWGM
jgi:hypothetical protein